MLYNNAAVSNLGQGYWECLRVGGTHTRDRGKTCRSKFAASFSPVLRSELRATNKLIRIEMGPIGGLVESWFKLV